MKLITLLSLFLVLSCGKIPDPAPQPKPTPIASKVQIGTMAISGMDYLWNNADSLDDATKAQPLASPKKTTVYTVSVSSKCGVSKASVTVKVFTHNANGELVEVTK